MSRAPTSRQAERIDAAAERLDRVHERFEALGLELTSGGLTLTIEEAEGILDRLEDHQGAVEASFEAGQRDATGEGQ